MQHWDLSKPLETAAAGSPSCFWSFYITEVEKHTQECRYLLRHDWTKNRTRFVLLHVLPAVVVVSMVINYQTRVCSCSGRIPPSEQFSSLVLADKALLLCSPSGDGTISCLRASELLFFLCSRSRSLGLAPLRNTVDHTLGICFVNKLTSDFWRLFGVTIQQHDGHTLSFCAY